MHRLRALTLVLLPALVVACGGDDTVTTPSEDADVIVTATDNVFDAETYEAQAGDVQIAYLEQGSLPHTLLIEGVNGFKLSVSTSKELDEKSVMLDPGTYTLYCDIPGHRATMEAELVVT